MNKKNETLHIKNLQVSVGEKKILYGVTFSVESGSIHAVMGPNGSGKSTLAYAVMGHPSYVVHTPVSRIQIQKKDIVVLSPEERAKEGLFLAFQSPTAIPGVTVMSLLRTAYQELYPEKTVPSNTVQNPLLARRWSGGGISIQDFTKKVKEFTKELEIDDSFLSRGIHDGFSGGEKKKIEILQALVFAPAFAFFDEIDTGLDVDALKVVAKGIRILKKMGTGVLVITHYNRILEYLTPDFVHVLVNGKIVTSGKAQLAKEIEAQGYGKYISQKKVKNQN